MTRRIKYFLLLLIFTQTGLAQQDTVLTGDSVRAPDDSYVEELPAVNATADPYKYFQEGNQIPDSVFTRRIPDSLVKKLQGEDEFWYANREIKKVETKKTKARTALFQQQWFQTLLWIVIIGGFAGFLIWYLAGSNIVLFRKKKRSIDEDLAENELSTEDLFAINYQKEIDKAIREKNHRLATRLMFLRLLKDLSEKNIIDYKQGKTNFDYLLQLQPTRYYPDFFRITRNYEYSWYGQFEVGPEKFALIKKDFDQFEKNLYR